MAKKTATKNVGETPPWYQQCLDNIKKIPGGTLCSDSYCNEVKDYTHKICNCEPPYTNGCIGTNPPPNCCSYTASSPVFVVTASGQGCYCCCGGTASVAEVAVSKSGAMPADQLKKGDAVYAPKDASLSQWTSVALQFVSLSKTSGENPQVNILLRDAKGKEQRLIVGARQLLMLPGKKFKEAGKLVPGIDQLVNKDGNAVDIENVQAGTYTQFIPYLSAAAAPASDPAGHLLVLNGFIAGDYSLTLGIGEEHLAANHGQLPNAGTPAYKERYPHLD